MPSPTHSPFQTIDATELGKVAGGASRVTARSSSSNDQLTKVAGGASRVTARSNSND